MIAKTSREASARPIVIIDPRAGHGPGIGGTKRDSEIGMALDQRHPVYVILFSTRPVTGQTLDHVQLAMARFVETVRDRHPQAGNPALIGNCQAGWAAALLGAVRPDITGPIVMNGAPLSYWAGVKGQHPMRYKGGLTGGPLMPSAGRPLALSLKASQSTPCRVFMKIITRDQSSRLNRPSKRLSFSWLPQW